MYEDERDRYDELTGKYEYDAGMSREEAEFKAWEELATWE